MKKNIRINKIKNKRLYEDERYAKERFGNLHITDAIAFIEGFNKAKEIYKKRK
jgi:hypothetical protein